MRTLLYKSIINRQIYVFSSGAIKIAPEEY